MRATQEHKQIAAAAAAKLDEAKSAHAQQAEAAEAKQAEVAAAATSLAERLSQADQTARLATQ